MVKEGRKAYEKRKKGHTRKAYEKMDGPFFASFVKENLNLCFAKVGPRRRRQRIFVMDIAPAKIAK